MKRVEKKVSIKKVKGENTHAEDTFYREGDKHVHIKRRYTKCFFEEVMVSIIAAQDEIRSKLRRPTPIPGIGISNEDLQEDMKSNGLHPQGWRWRILTCWLMHI